MGGALRILQIGELLLDQPLHGDFSRLPVRLQSQVVNARYLALQRAFSTAISQQVDFVLIAGRLCEQLEDSRPYWFLHQACEQLERHGIKVLWAEPTVRSHWPAYVDMPENLIRILRGQAVDLLTSSDGGTLSVAWNGTEHDWGADVQLLLKETSGNRLSVAYECVSSESGFTVNSPLLQADCSSESPVTQATIIEYQKHRGMTQSQVSMAEVKFQQLEYLVTEGSISALKQMLAERMQRLATQPAIAPLQFVSIVLKTTVESPQSSLSFTDCREILRALQSEALANEASVWPCSLEIDCLTGSRGEFSPALRVAMNELEQIQIDDVYDNLDLHVLEWSPESLPSLKRRVASRLPHLLMEPAIR